MVEGGELNTTECWAFAVREGADAATPFYHSSEAAAAVLDLDATPSLVLAALSDGHVIGNAGGGGGGNSKQ